MMVVLFAAVGMLAGFAQGPEGASNLIQPYPDQVLRHEVVAFKPKAGHHFSLEAPQKCDQSAPVELRARVIKCQFLNSGESRALLNVCDDKKSFCKPVEVNVRVAEQSTGEPVRLTRNEHLNESVKKVLVPGFVAGAVGEMKSQAGKRGAPVFVMVSTDWCPPCNEAKEYFLNSEAFQAVSANWMKIYVDGDSLGSVDWEKVVPYHFYPSFILLNARMEEVARYTGEMRQSDFSKWARVETARLTDPIRDLKIRVNDRMRGGLLRKILDFVRGVDSSARRADEVRLLKWALDVRDRSLVEKITRRGPVPELDAQLLPFELDRLNEDAPQDDSKTKELLARILAASISGEDWAEWLTQLCENDKAACVTESKKVNLRLKILNDRPALSPAERASMMGEEYLALASVFDKLGEVARRREFARKCLESYDQLTSLSRLKTPRSARQNAMPCFEMADRFHDAEGILKDLVETYPSEPTFMVRLARLYRKQKKPKLALEWLDRSDRVAYGFNWFSGQLVRGDVLLDLGRNEDAARVIELALAELPLNHDRDNRYQLVASRLRAAQTKVLALRAGSSQSSR